MRLVSGSKISVPLHVGRFSLAGRVLQSAAKKETEGMTPTVFGTPWRVVVVRHDVMMIVMNDNFPAILVIPVVMMVGMNHISARITIHLAYMIVLFTPIMGLC